MCYCVQQSFIAANHLPSLRFAQRKGVNGLTSTNGGFLQRDGNRSRSPDGLFQNGVITAIDGIISLGDQGLITYGLQWYDTIGTAEIVRSYYIAMDSAD